MIYRVTCFLLSLSDFAFHAYQFELRYYLCTISSGFIPSKRLVSHQFIYNSWIQTLEYKYTLGNVPRYYLQ